MARATPDFDPTDIIDDDLSDVRGGRIRRGFRRLFGRASGGRTTTEEPRRTRPRRRWILRAVVGVAVLLAIYYGPVPLLIQNIDDDPAFAPAQPVEGASRVVEMATALIRREVDSNRWTANDPFFLPTAALDNMPNFQIGIVDAIRRVAIEMLDHIGRTRGSSEEDPDLKTAAGSLNWDPRAWIFDLSSFNPLPRQPAESAYRDAAEAFGRYNTRLAAGTAAFDRRADNLRETLERISQSLGSSSAEIADRVDGRVFWLIDTRSDDIFYMTKGRLYAYYMLLSALGEDFADVLGSSNLGPIWTDMLQSLAQAAAINPLVVFNGAPDGSLLPNHLTAQGFYLLT